MKTLEQIRNITKQYKEKDKEKSMHDIFLKHRAYIEKEILRSAKKGLYCCWSEKLTATFSDDDYEYIDELRNYLKNKITIYFHDAWEYDVSYIEADDCMLISWQEEKGWGIIR